MKKNMIGFCFLLFALMLCSVGCMMFGQDHEPVQVETEASTEALPEETEPPYRLMIITGTTLNIRTGPGTEYEVVGQLQEGELVKVWEEDGDWGRIDQGWISMKYAQDYEQAEDPEIPDEGDPGRDPEQSAGSDTPTEPSQSQDKSSLLEGTWYQYSYYEKDTYFLYVRTFNNGIFSEKSYWYYVNTGEMYNLGGSEGTYSFDGQYATVDNPPYAYNDKFLVKISGNTMTWVSSDSTWQRVSLKQIQSQINQQHNKPALNTALVGSWYRVSVAQGQGWGYVAIYSFDANGNVKDTQVQYVPENPNTGDYMGSYNLTYTYDGTNLTIDGGAYTVSVSGNTMTLNGQTYKKGTVHDGFAELAAIFAPAAPEPTEPPVEVPETEPPEEQGIND